MKRIEHRDGAFAILTGQERRSGLAPPLRVLRGAPLALLPHASPLAWQDWLFETLSTPAAQRQERARLEHRERAQAHARTKE